MLRMHNLHMPGWTAMQQTQNTQKMNEMINDHIELIPQEVRVPAEGRSLRIVCPMEVFNVHVLKQCTKRSQEECNVEHAKYKCWEVDDFLVWKKISKNTESMGSCTFYKQDTRAPGVLSSASLASDLVGPGIKQKMGRVNKYSSACGDQNYVGSVSVTTFILRVMESTALIQFESDRSMAKNKERNQFSVPKAVNICYTGTVGGNIAAEIIRCATKQNKKRGPCGSEIHIDTSMGVLQIYGNNSGCHKITCKAFLKIEEAEYIVDRVCMMVRAAAPLPTVQHARAPSPTAQHARASQPTPRPLGACNDMCACVCVCGWWGDTAQDPANLRTRHAHAGVVRKHRVQDGSVEQRIHGGKHEAAVASIFLHAVHRGTQYPCNFPLGLCVEHLSAATGQSVGGQQCAGQAHPLQHTRRGRTAVECEIPPRHGAHAQHHNAGHLHLPLREETQAAAPHRSGGKHLACPVLRGHGKIDFQGLQVRARHRCHRVVVAAVLLRPSWRSEFCVTMPYMPWQPAAASKLGCGGLWAWQGAQAMPLPPLHGMPLSPWGDQLPFLLEHPPILQVELCDACSGLPTPHSLDPVPVGVLVAPLWPHTRLHGGLWAWQGAPATPLPPLHGMPLSPWGGQLPFLLEHPPILQVELCDA